MDAALYARVSTGDQQTLPMQLEQMREYAKKRGWTIKHEIIDTNPFIRVMIRNVPIP